MNARVLLAGLPAVFSLVACKDSPGRPVSLSVTSAPVASTMPASLARSFGLTRDIVVTGTNGSVKLTKAEVVLSDIELQPVGAATGCNGSNTDGCDMMEAPPIVVDLPLTQGSISVLLNVTVPEGRYRAFEAEINAMKAGKEGSTAFFKTYSSWESGKSIRVAGVYTPATGPAKNFTYLSAVEADIESVFTQPIEVKAGGTANITLNIDVGSWFKSSATGPVLDPSNPANAAAIDANIKRSLRAFEDNGRRGVEEVR